jgi:hypothetical protein
MTDRRRFTRILYLTPALLIQGDKQWHVDLLDLSLRGALVQQPDDWTTSADPHYTLRLHLTGSDVAITMQVELVHQENVHIGFYCHQIDLESATHLKQIIALHLGSDELLHRELGQLLSEPC